MILIIGAGRLGSSLAKRLAEAGQDVTVLDHDRGNFEANLPRDFKGRTVTGMEIDNDVLKRAGIERADAVACVARDESTNMMAADAARKIFGVRNVIVRLDNSRLAELYRQEGFEVISPILEGTRAIEAALL
ncbi:MAG TPA: TrkA family potassium uptake protein, partial [Oscillatoriaceae cyanobacterium]